MNSTIISDGKLLELKDLAKEISEIELQLMCFGNNSYLEYKQRKLTERLTELIKTL